MRTMTALFLLLVLLFSFKGEVILANPLTIIWISIPLFLQTVFIFSLGYGAAKLMKLNYEDAAQAALIGALSRLYNMRLPILSVEYLPEGR